MAGATALGIGLFGGAAAVITAPAILTNAVVGASTGVAVNWVWDLLTPQPKSSIENGSPLASPLSAGESCRFVSSSSENSRPSVFSDTGLGNLHIFMEDRAPLIFENFSISSSEQVTLTVNPPAFDGVTVEELAAAIDDAVITFEEIDGEELEATPEPTIEAAPTATPAISEPPSDQGLTNLTASQVHAAVAQFSNNEGWTFHDADEVITNESAYSYRSGKVLTKALQACPDNRCFGEGVNYTLGIHFSPVVWSGDHLSATGRGTHCTVRAYKATSYRSAFIEFEIWEGFNLETVRVNGIPVPPEDACAGFSTEYVQDEILRLFDDFVILLGP